ncbi:unnamed protein product [Caenorhabditis nigoni]
MNHHSFLLLVIAILKFSDSCLVIRYDKPPACACKSLKLDSSNIKESQVKENNLYDLVLSSEIKSPEILIDDCSVRVHCEGESELYIFDTDKGAKIGDYSLDGFCDPYQQKWQVDTGNGMEQYKELKGVCVLKKVEKCSPTDPSTLLFAYSNDLAKPLESLCSGKFVMSTDEETRYKTAATVRFDTKTKGDIVFHEGSTQKDSFDQAEAHVIEQKLDPSQSFDSLETGSDVLDMLERFVDTNHPNLCGSFVFIAMTRNPNEVEISKLVGKIRAHRIQLTIAVKESSSGGGHPETMYDLAAKTNGYCAFSERVSDAMYNLPFHMYSDAYYSFNVKASGTGSMVLPPLTITKKLKNSYLIVGVQSTGTSKSFQSLTLSWENTELGISGSVTKTREDLDHDWSSSLNTFQNFDIKEVQPATYQLKLDYSYLTEDTILIRINSKAPTDHWLSYQD